jgi:hypothetical protein
LRPLLAVTGHGLPMAGPRLQQELEALAGHWPQLALPAHEQAAGRENA